MSLTVEGVFKIHDTFGYPLEQIMEELRDQGLHVDVSSWINDAFASGWSYDQMKRKFCGAFKNVFPDVLICELPVDVAFTCAYLAVTKES